MAYTLIPTTTVVNVSQQLVKINIKAKTGSTIFNSKGGTVSIVPKASIEAETSRFDAAQLASIAGKKLITYSNSQRKVTLDNGATDN